MKRTPCCSPTGTAVVPFALLSIHAASLLKASSGRKTTRPHQTKQDRPSRLAWDDYIVAQGADEQREEHDHETCFCSGVGAGLCGRIDGRLCPRHRSWRGSWLCARRRYGARIRSRFWQPGAADARFRKPDSGPARGTTAGTRDQRPDVAAVAPGHVAAGAGMPATLRRHATPCCAYSIRR